MRYSPHTTADREKLLKQVGVATVDQLFKDIPASVKLKSLPGLPTPLSEMELLEELTKASDNNSPANFMGGGSYRHFIPSVVNHLVSRSEFYTAYTPYQPEISQGILQAIYEYQTMICNLTGMFAANASMYDGATALAEAALLACRTTNRKEIVVSSTVNPHYRQVLKTYAYGADLKVIELPYDPKTGQTITSDPLGPPAFTPIPTSGLSPSCVILQQPNYFGCLEDITKVAEKIHANGSLFITSVNPISLGLLKAPADYGADIVVGEGQPLGNLPSFGGPGLGIFAVKKELVRQIPGRVVGMTADHDNRRGFCLTLQTREQHIRREKATSNICSNEALVALAASVYLSTMGKHGLRQVAELCLQKANYLKERLADKAAFSGPIFNEFVVKTSKPVGIDLAKYYPELKGSRLICVTELLNKAALDSLTI